MRPDREGYRPSRPVLVLAVARFLGAVSSYMVLPFISVRLIESGTGFAVAGLVTAAGPAVTALAGVLGGMAADTIGRRRSLAIGNTLTMLSMIGFAFAGGTVAFALLSALNGLARAVAGPAGSAVVADVTRPQDRAQAYAYGRVALNVGAAIGPFLGAFLVLDHPRTLFLSSAVAELGIVLLVLALVPETGRQLRTVSHREAARQMASDRALWLYVVGGAMQLGTYMIIETIFPAFLRGAVPSGLTLYAVMSLVNTGMVVALQIPLNRRLGRLPASRGFAVALSLFALAYLGFAYIRLPAALLATMVVFTLAEMLVFVVMPPFEASLGEDAVRGRVFGVVGLKRLGAALWPLGAGVLLQTGGPQLAFPVVAGLAVVAALILWQAARRKEAAAQEGVEIEA